jgi:hypothetical protein
MATINDVFNQLVTVNATLSAIGADVNAGTTATNAVKASVDQLDTDLKAGFAQTANALNNAVALLGAIAAVEVEEVKILFHLSQQTDTMICSLEHISQNTCAILTQSTIQTRLQTKMGDDLGGLLAIAQSAHPAAALERERLAALQVEIRRCCPPPTEPPACTYEPCPKPRPISEPKLPQLPKVGERSPVR